MGMLKTLLGAYFGVPTSLGGLAAGAIDAAGKAVKDTDTTKSDAKSDKAEQQDESDQNKENKQSMSAIPNFAAPQMPNLFQQQQIQQGQFPITNSLMQDPMWNTIVKRMMQQQQQQGGGQ